SRETGRGRSSDHRSDIFTFGAILYEMLTGQRAFHGDTAADTMSAILHKEPPDLAESKPNLSLPIQRIVRHCLEKSPEQRFQSASDIAFDLETLSDVSGQSTTAPLLAMRPRKWALAQTALTALLAVLAAGFAIAYFKRTPQPVQTVRFSFAGESGAYGAIDLFNVFILQMAFSPDGRFLVFPAPYLEGKNVLWLRELNHTAATPLIGTEDATYPFWSPDDKFIGF